MSTKLSNIDSIDNDEPIYALIDEVPMAGDRQAHYLRDIGIDTVGDLRDADEADIEQANKVNGIISARLKAYAEGIQAVNQLGDARLRVLEYEGVETIDDLAECTRDELLAMPTFGDYVVSEVERVVSLAVEASAENDTKSDATQTELGELFG